MIPLIHLLRAARQMLGKRTNLFDIELRYCKILANGNYQYPSHTAKPSLFPAGQAKVDNSFSADANTVLPKLASILHALQRKATLPTPDPTLHSRNETGPQSIDGSLALILLGQRHSASMAIC